MEWYSIDDEDVICTGTIQAEQQHKWIREKGFTHFAFCGNKEIEQLFQTAPIDASIADHGRAYKDNDGNITVLIQPYTAAYNAHDFVKWCNQNGVTFETIESFYYPEACTAYVLKQNH